MDYKKIGHLFIFSLEETSSHFCSLYSSFQALLIDSIFFISAHVEDMTCPDHLYAYLAASMSVWHIRLVDFTKKILHSVKFTTRQSQSLT